MTPTSPTSPTSSDATPSAQPSHVPTRGLYGSITHTEFGSEDPAATKAWCAKVLGWTFKPSFQMPSGEYHLFAFSDKGGGGIHQANPPESPGSVPFVHVEDAHAAFAKAISEGAVAISPP